jgi:hypothetical protein
MQCRLRQTAKQTARMRARVESEERRRIPMKSSVRLANCGRDGGGGRAGVYGVHGGGGILGGGTGGGF